MTAEGAAAEVTAAAPARPHGHGLLARLLPEIAGRVDRGSLVEVGTTREHLPGQGSTAELAALAGQLGLPFVTVDMDPANTEQARAEVGAAPGFRAVTALGEEFLASFDEPVLAAYLDAFDIQHGQHSEDRIERYHRYLGTEITDAGAAAMHLACARALIPRVVPGGLVVIDDTWADGEGYAGKGRDAVPALLAGGFRVVGRTKTAIALQREGEASRMLPAEPPTETRTPAQPRVQPGPKTKRRGGPAGPAGKGARRRPWPVRIVRRALRKVGGALRGALGSDGRG
jgi:hypothetical protein